MVKAKRVMFWAILTLAPGVAYAQHPPVQSPQDQTCRNEAAQRVFAEPDPAGLGLYARGRQYWTECMNREQRTHRRAKA